MGIHSEIKDTSEDKSKQQLTVPIIDANSKGSLQFVGNTQVEVHYDVGFLGDYHAPNGLDDFVISFFTRLAEANNGDTKYIKERKKEIDIEVNKGDKECLIYWADDIRYIINTVNIVKLTCKKLGITQKELAELIGYSLPAVKKAVSDNKISEPMQKAIELYLETLELKKEISNYQTLKKALKKALS